MASLPRPVLFFFRTEFGGARKADGRFGRGKVPRQQARADDDSEIAVAGIGRALDIRDRRRDGSG